MTINKYYLPGEGYGNYNLLVMELFGKNIEQIMIDYIIPENSKYMIAYNLLNTLSCIHRCGIIHRDIKPSNIVIDSNDFSDGEMEKRCPAIIDFGLSQSYYSVKGKTFIKRPCIKYKGLTGTVRYISLNIHERNTPTIIDDIVGLAYSLLVIFVGKDLPWMSHLKDSEAFDKSQHTKKNCKCGFHKNLENGTTKENNTVAEVKYHYDLNNYTDGKYQFLIKWIKYLYSLNLERLPSYDYLLKQLTDEFKELSNVKLKDLKFCVIQKPVKDGNRRNGSFLD